MGIFADIAFLSFCWLVVGLLLVVLPIMIWEASEPHRKATKCHWIMVWSGLGPMGILVALIIFLGYKVIVPFYNKVFDWISRKCPLK